PTDALQRSLHTLVANVNRPHGVLREVSGDMHAFPHKSRSQLAALELRINHQQIAKADPARRFMRAMQNLPPNTVPGRLAIPLGNQHPIRPTGKRGTYPFGISLCCRVARHVRIGMVTTKVAGERAFANSHEGRYVSRRRTPNIQKLISYRRNALLKVELRKITGKIQQRIHEEKTAVLEGVNCGQVIGWHPASHAFRPAASENGHELAD